MASNKGDQDIEKSPEFGFGFLSALHKVINGQCFLYFLLLQRNISRVHLSKHHSKEKSHC